MHDEYHLSYSDFLVSVDAMILRYLNMFDDVFLNRDDIKKINNLYRNSPRKNSLRYCCHERMYLISNISCNSCYDPIY